MMEKTARGSVPAIILLFILCITMFSCGCAEEAPIKIRALILPKFEIGELTGDYAGEAQLFYEAFFMDADAFEIAGGQKEYPLYINRDGLALCVTGQGKVKSAVRLAAILCDGRFDFSDAYIISVGCCGNAVNICNIADVSIISATVDFDLGHTADVRDLRDPDRSVTWFHDESFDPSSHRILNRRLTDKVYELTKDIRLDTSDALRDLMALQFNHEVWAVRDPMVIKGTSVTGDNYWKGIHGHNNAVAVAEFYHCPDPFTATEMEDNALAVVADDFGLLDRFICIRAGVNVDVFLGGDTPESLWGGAVLPDETGVDIFEGVPDIFAFGMNNCFKVGARVVEAIFNGELADD